MFADLPQFTAPCYSSVTLLKSYLSVHARSRKHGNSNNAMHILSTIKTFLGLVNFELCVMILQRNNQEGVYRYI